MSAGADPETSEEAGKEPNPLLRLALEVGPLVVFFVANARAGILTATWIFMIAVLAALVGSRLLENRWPVMPGVTAAFVLVFGGLTVWLEDELFIKLKPTIVNVLFGTALLVGLLFRRALLKPLFGTSFSLSDEGWRVLTLRWGLFFYFLAALNEVVWRGFSTDTWVSFKLFGIMPLTLLFSGLQLPLLQRHALEPAPAASGGDRGDGARD